jgi:nucleolar MIF4G domain-containing protein 1
MLQDEMKKRDPTSISVRHKFMAEFIIELKNNKHKKRKIDGNTQSERLKKFIANFSRKHSCKFFFLFTKKIYLLLFLLFSSHTL